MEFFSDVKKYKKYFKIKYKVILRYPVLSSSSSFGFLILKSFNMTINQFKICWKTIKRYIKKKNKEIKIRFRVFPDKIITKKPREIRMGRGKGLVFGRIAPVKAGTIILEFSNLSERQAFFLFNKCVKKIPVDTIFVKKND